VNIFKSSGFRRATLLTTSVGLGSAASLLALGLLFYTCGREWFGEFSVLLALTTIIRGIGAFDTWQSVIHYYPRMSESSFVATARALVALDYIGAVFSSLLYCFVFVVFGQYIYPEYNAADIFIACSLLLITGSSSAGAILRVKRLDWAYSAHQALPAVIKFGAAAFGSSMHLEPIAMFIVWLGVDACMAIFANTVVRRHGVTGCLINYICDLRNAWTLKGKFVNILGYTYLHSTLKILVRELDTLVVAAMLGAGDAGAFRIIKTAVGSILRVGDLVYVLIDTHVSTLVASQSWGHIVKLIRMHNIGVGVLFAALGLCAFGALNHFNDYLLGALAIDYRGLLAMLCFLMGGAWLSMLGLPYRSIGVGAGRQDSNFYCLVILAVTYFALIAPLVHYFDSVGAAISYFLAYLAWYLAQYKFYQKIVRGVYGR
jgi:O-antigen/teichoic acid export membrane protein